jgi:cyclopropane-fatty-acyl-phospholipid synthase
MIAQGQDVSGSHALGIVDRFVRRLAFRGLQRISEGTLDIVDGAGHRRFGTDSRLHALVRVHDPQFYRQLMLGGSLGASDAYVRGEWDCDDLTSLFRIIVRNQAAASDLEGPASALLRMWQRVIHRWRANTKSGSRQNIRAHYDLGNDFFRLWLDETWAYSCGIFPASEVTLQEASREKFDRACRKLGLCESDHLLEIGAGWGGLAIHAARNFGCRVTTTTISGEQHDLAEQRIRKAGLNGQVSLLFEDYRDLRGQFDKLVSIEMIEAVGHEYLDAYFQQCGALLKPTGSMLLQAIVMPERGYKKYLRSVDFIRRDIFPGGCLPSVSSILESVGRSSRLRLVHLEDMAPHYAETLRRWRANLEEHRQDVRRLGYSNELMRLWHYYLCYCEAAFEERAVGVVQIVFDNYASRRDPLTVTQAAANMRGPEVLAEFASNQAGHRLTPGVARSVS